MKCIIFNHIPKTAGSTFLSIIHKQYGENYYHLDAMDVEKSLLNFAKMNVSKKKNVSCISGHLSYKLKDELSQDFELITMLREPIDQFLSTYFYIKRATWNRNHKVVSKMNSIAEFVDFSVENNFFNQQTRYLSEDTNHILNKEFPSLPVNEELYQNAVHNLSKHKYVFVTERFDEAILILKNELGWRTPYYKISNKTKNRTSVSSLSSNELDLIIQHNKYDVELYNLAKGLHQELLEGQKESFNNQLKKFNFINKIKSII